MKQKKIKLKDSTLLKHALSGTRRYFLVGCVAVLFAVVTSYILPLALSFVTDYVLQGNDTQLLWFFKDLAARYSSEFLLQKSWILVLAIIAVAIINAAFSFLRQRSAAFAAEGMARNMRNELYSHLQDVPYDYHKHASAGDIVQRCSSDVDMIRRFVATQLLEILRVALMVVVSVVIMLQISARMTLITVCLLPVLLLVSYIFFTLVTKHFLRSDEAEGHLMTVLQENLSGARTVRAFGQQSSEREKFREINEEYKQINIKLSRIMGFFWGATDLAGSLQIVVAVVFGAYYAFTGMLTLGGFLIFSQFAVMLTFPVRQLGRILADFGKAKVSLGRLDEIINVPVEKEPGKALTPEIKGKIEFNDVHFCYADGYDDVLNGVNFKVEPGQTVAILGSTGSGKTSLVHLLQRLYECTAGEILIDGVNVNDIERHHLRRNIGMVLQEPFLYSRTILENLRITDPEAPEELVYESARIAAVHDVITKFDKGYDTVVGERGVTLSGGQKQRVAIARMLMQNAPILVFDDSMSSVDTETDSAIRAALRRRRKDVTTILISHRITTLSEADFIVVLEDGVVTQMGSHEQLLKQDGLYKRIADVQELSEESLLAEAKKEGEA